MKSRKSTLGSVDVSGADNRACPSCNNKLVRTWRRPIDRLMSHFVPVHRYRCESFKCQWQGNLRTHSTASASHHGNVRRNGIVRMGRPDGSRLLAFPRSFVVSMLLAVVAMLIVMVFTTTNRSVGSTLATTEQNHGKWLASGNLSDQVTGIQAVAPPDAAMKAAKTAARPGPP